MSYVPWSSASKENILFFVSVGGQAEVDDHRLKGLSSKHYIFGFDVAMHDSTFMHVLQTLQKSSNEGSCLTVRKLSFAIFYSLEQGFSCEKLHDDINGVFRLENTLKFEDILLGSFVQLSK